MNIGHWPYLSAQTGTYTCSETGQRHQCGMYRLSRLTRISSQQRARYTEVCGFCQCEYCPGLVICTTGPGFTSHPLSLNIMLRCFRRSPMLKQRRRTRMTVNVGWGWAKWVLDLAQGSPTGQRREGGALLLLLVKWYHPATYVLIYFYFLSFPKLLIFG